MLAIDGQRPERGAVEELLRYALQRLRGGIALNADSRSPGST